ncbi:MULTISPECIES: hypothetical protein [unclassified Paraburkholderia]|uniref:hypothetical protein n=1 Tax=unclassified Paraburkholderia TaxID=2615204 RepID=UPI001981E0E0|nr:MULTISPECIES: hypothetical protein [unclassified Paraburkholderia]MBN3857770.1 hypothetical protein [Paraburkholderia sp. Ac-20340]
MKQRKPSVKRNQAETQGQNDQPEAQKPVSAIFVDALALSRVANAETEQSLVTNLTFHPHGSATIHLKEGTFDIALNDCAISKIEAADGVSVILMLSPAPMAA